MTESTRIDLESFQVQQQQFRVLADRDLFGCDLFAVAVFALELIPFVEQLLH
jgi:hypothetical protein